nr:hypothetical protein [Serratia sp. FS14]
MSVGQRVGVDGVGGNGDRQDGRQLQIDAAQRPAAGTGFLVQIDGGLR